MKKMLFFVTVIFFALQGCSNTKKTNAVIPVADTVAANKLNGAWELAYMSGVKIALEGLFPNKKPLLNLHLPDTQAKGNGGCNGFGCVVKVNNTQISFSNILSTMMACEGNGEPVFFRTLESVTSYSVDANTLTMYKAGTMTMTFRRK